VKALAAKISPRPTAASARTDIYVSSGGSGAAAGIGGIAWEAAIVRRPRLTIELFSVALDGRTQLGRGDMVLNLNRIRRATDIKAYFWLGAPIILYDATDLNLPAAPVEFTGYVKTTSYDTDTDQLTLNFEVSATALDRPVLFSEFTGGGGLAGDPQLRGTPKPAGFGSVLNVEPLWFDNARNIGMIDGYSNCTAITALFEGGNDFGARVADYADYATLAARIDDHTVAPGRWATCVAQGLVGLGAPPVKPITVDATFGTNRPGALIQRLLSVHAAIAGGSIDAAAFAALDAAVNYPVHHWMAEQRTVRDLVESIAASCNAAPLVTFQGLYSVTRAFGGAVAASINRQAPKRSTRVTKWRALDPDVPTWRMRARTARPGVTLTIDQINYADDLIDRGVYAPGTVYRQGNLVWTADGAQYVYTNITPASGHAPPVSPTTSNAYWEETRPPTTAADLTYADGTPIEDLKPAQPNADVTADNTALGDGNRVRLTLMEAGPTGWAIIYNPAALASAVSTGIASSLHFFRGSATFTANGQAFTIGNPLRPEDTIPVRPGERISFQIKIGVAFGSNAALRSSKVAIGWLDAAGAQLGTSFDFPTVAGNIAFPTLLQAFITVPAGAFGCWIDFASSSGTGGAGTVELTLSEPMVSSAGATQTVFPTFTPGPGNEFAADVTAALVGPASSDVLYDNSGVTFQSAEDLNYIVQNRTGTVTSDVAMSYRVLSGEFNGFNLASGLQSLAVTAGVASITPTSLTTSTATIEIVALLNGRALPALSTNISKKLAAATPTGTGGGGGGATDIASQSSGFTAINTATFTTITGSLPFTMPTGKTTLRCVVDLTCKYPKTASQIGPWDVESKVLRGGVDQGATEHSDPDNEIVEEDGRIFSSPGTIQFTRDMTGLTPGTQYTITVQARVASGALPAASLMSFFGAVTLSAP
jgi:hypothetical protein